MSRILVIGATRGIGLETVKAAVKAKHHVRAFARSANNLDVDDSHLEKFSGDATNAEDTARALKDIDVVIQALGTTSNRAYLSGTDLFSRATRTLIDAMAESPVRRLIAVTGFGAGDSRDHLGALYGLAFHAALKRIYDDKDIQEQMIKASNLDWTIVRPGLLRDGPATYTYRASADPFDWRMGGVRRADVAQFLMEEVETSQFLKKTPVVTG